MRYGEKTLSTMKSGRELIIYLGNWKKKIRHFLFLCFAFPDLLFWERCEFFRKGVENLKRRFSSRGAAVALNSLLLPGSAENAPARRDHSETWQMPGYIKALTRTLNKVTMWASRFQTHWKSGMGRPAAGEDQQEWRKECRIRTVMKKISGMLKMARSVLPAGAESDIAFIFKIEAKLRSVEELLSWKV